MTADYEIGQWTSGIAAEHKGREFAMTIRVDDRAATREALLASLRRHGVTVKTRSEWHARIPQKSLEQDWNYRAIALHHAGNSFSCGMRGFGALRKAEDIDFERFHQLSYHFAIDCTGTVYEALDIREKGAHIEGGNAGVIGVVFLADFSVRGETEKYGPGTGNVLRKRGVTAAAGEWFGTILDKLAVAHDEPTALQIAAAYVLIERLQDFFDIGTLGGHREFARKRGSSRACPGTYGMILAENMRKKTGLSAP